MKTKTVAASIIACLAIAATISLASRAHAQRNTIFISKMQFARDPNGQRGLTMFEPKDHTIYCIVTVSNPSAEAKYKFVWSYYDRAQNQRKELYTQDLDNQTAGDVISKFSSSHDLANGSYTVDIYIDGRKRQSRNFYV